MTILPDQETSEAEKISPRSRRRQESKRPGQENWPGRSLRTIPGSQLRLELHAPIRFADELRPAGDREVARGVERLPLRADWLVHEPHVGLLGGLVRLPLVALDAGQDAVFPRA